MSKNHGGRKRAQAGAQAGRKQGPAQLLFLSVPCRSDSLFGENCGGRKQAQAGRKQGASGLVKITLVDTEFPTTLKYTYTYTYTCTYTCTYTYTYTRLDSNPEVTSPGMTV